MNGSILSLFTATSSTFLLHVSFTSPSLLVRSSAWLVHSSHFSIFVCHCLMRIYEIRMRNEHKFDVIYDAGRQVQWRLINYQLPTSTCLWTDVSCLSSLLLHLHSRFDFSLFASRLLCQPPSRFSRRRIFPNNLVTNINIRIKKTKKKLRHSHSVDTG